MVLGPESHSGQGLCRQCGGPHGCEVEPATRRNRECIKAVSYTHLDVYKRQPLLHLVRVDVYGLHELPLEPALRTVVLKIMLWRRNARHVASHWAVTRRTCFLVINAKVGVVGKEIELVAEAFHYCAGEILRFRQSQVVERFVYDRKGAILARQGRKVNLGIENSRPPNDLR